MTNTSHQRTKDPFDLNPTRMSDIAHNPELREMPRTMTTRNVKDQIETGMVRERKALNAGMEAGIRLAMQDGGQEDFETFAPEQQRRDEASVDLSDTERQARVEREWDDIADTVSCMDLADLDGIDVSVYESSGCTRSKYLAEVRQNLRFGNRYPQRDDTDVQYEADAEAYDDTQIHLAELACDEEIESHSARQWSGCPTEADGDF